ncbi:MAG: hypothetical protein RBR15_17665 [Sphaerochaeta sp.]|nr:hypothetical protein [Sphaerochaeta sp.]
MKVLTPVRLCMKIVLYMMLLIFLGGSLSAVGANLTLDHESTTLKISKVEPEIQYYRYQFNSERKSKWITFGNDKPHLIFSYEELKGNILYLQQSYNGVTWSESSAYRYDEVSATWIRIEVQKKAVSEALPREESLSQEVEAHADIPFGLYGVSEISDHETITLKISKVEPEIQYYRYQFNSDQGAKWITFGRDKPHLIFSYEELKGNILYLQQSYNGVTWSESSAYRYDEVSAAWLRIQIQKEAVSEALQRERSLSLDVEAHANIPFGLYDEYFKMGLGGKIQLNKTWQNNLIGGAALSYTYGVSKTTRVDDFHKIQVIGVAGYEMILHPSISLIPELGVGALLHMPVGTVFANGTHGLYNFIDFVVEAGVKIKITLGKTIQIYTAPKFRVFVESDSLGMLGEVAIGTRVTL